MLASGPLSVPRAERICKIYFFAGFAGLPFLWFATWFFFRHHAQYSVDIQWYTEASLRLCVAGGALLLLWYFLALCFLPASSPLFAVPFSSDGERWS